MEKVDNKTTQENISQAKQNLNKNGNSESSLRCCKFSLKKIILCLGFLLIVLFAFQFYQTKTLKPISCGGDWSYNVKCPAGTYCQSIGQGPLAGGFCTPYLLPWFNPASKIQPKIEISKLTPSPTLAPKDFPKIISLKKVDKDRYAINTTTFPKSMWLCIQPDFYSKPENKTCNSGSLFWYDKQDFYIDSDNAAIRLYSDSEHTQLYDEVLALELKSDKIRIAKLSNLCGKIEHNSQNGNYSIKDTRLLTSPGWQNLIPFINKDACVQGELYPDTSSIRVYFVEEANKTMDTYTPDETGAGWKTYTNNALNFQIKYPPNWEYSAIKAGNPLHLLLYPKHTSNMESRDPNDPLAPIDLLVLNTSPSENLQCLSEPNVNTCLDIQVNGIPAKRYQRNAYYDIVAFKKNDKLFELMSPKFDQSVFSKGQYPRAYYAFYNLPTEERKRIFDQILSTFKFTNP